MTPALPPSLLQTLLDALPLRLTLKTGQGRLLWLNRAAAEALGATAAELLGRAEQDLLTEAALLAQGPIEAGLLSGGPADVRDEFDAAANRSWRVTRLALSGPGGERLLLRCVADAGLPPDALSLSEAHAPGAWRSLIDQLPFGLSLKTAAGELKLVNRYTARRVGQTPQQLEGRTMAAVSTLVQQQMAGLDAQVLATGGPVSADFETRQAFGLDEERFQRVSKTLVELPGFAKPLILTTTVEVTDLRRAEQQAQRSMELLRAVTDTSPSMVSVKDPDQRYVLVNRVYCEICGLSEAQMLGRTPFEVHPNHAEVQRWVEADRRVLETGTTHEQEDHMVVGGVERVVWSIKRPLRLADGRLQVLCVATDITAMRLAESALRDALRRAEQASEAKSRFLANISHEIRTPINGMMGMTDLVLASALQPRQREYLQVARTSADALLAIVNEVLDLSKIDAGGMGIERLRFDLHALLRELSQATASTAHAKGLDFELQLSPELPRWVLGDPVRLRQVLANLLGNACKFTEQGHVLLTVMPGPQQTIGFVVRDTGPGIAPDRQQRVFEAFAQGDDSTTRRHGGTGLGLTISQRLVELMGGRLRLHSADGQGSSFEFNLALPGDADEPGVPAEPLAGRCIGWLALRRPGSDFLPQLLRGFGAQVQRIEAEGAGGGPVHTAAALADFDTLVLDCASVSTLPEPVQSLLRGWQALSPPRRLLVLQRLDLGLNPAAPGIGRPQRLTLPVLPLDLLRALQGRIDEVAAGPAAPAPGRADEDLLRGMMVLLAEDNMVNRLVVQAVVERLGGSLTLAEDGAQAWQLLQQRRFDLVLMDIQMPRLDGVEVLARRRALERAQGLPPARVIAMTAHAMQGDRERFLASGFDAYLSKPFSIEQLAAEIARMAPLA
ncbi:MAG: PAS domain-containing protein [Burkholderiaceae bacterium]|nr:PAS domain-containing protein [Burkholderiaceae bacterium]